MKTGKQDTIAEEKRPEAMRFKWKLVATFIPIVLAILMLMSAQFIREKVMMNYQVSNSFRAGDVAVFVAMPLLNAALK
jgi:hypothetical protein